MAKLISYISKKELNVSNNFILKGRNQEVVSKFLDYEAKVCNIIRHATNVGADVKTIFNSDSEISNYLLIMEECLQAEFQASKEEEKEVDLIFEFFTAIFLDIKDLFDSTRLIEIGFFQTYTKHISPYNLEVRTISLELANFVKQYKRDRFLDISYELVSYVSGHKVNLWLRNLNDIMIVEQIHFANCMAKSLIELGIYSKKSDLFVNTLPEGTSHLAAMAVKRNLLLGELHELTYAAVLDRLDSLKAPILKYVEKYPDVAVNLENFMSGLKNI